MLEKTTALDKVEIARDGAIQIRIGLRIVDDGKEISNQWHRTALEPGTSASEQFALVNQHLEQMGWPAVPAADIETVNRASTVRGG